MVYFVLIQGDAKASAGARRSILDPPGASLYRTKRCEAAASIAASRRRPAELGGSAAAPVVSAELAGAEMVVSASELAVAELMRAK